MTNKMIMIWRRHQRLLLTKVFEADQHWCVCPRGSVVKVVVWKQLQELWAKYYRIDYFIKRHMKND